MLTLIAKVTIQIIFGPKVETQMISKSQREVNSKTKICLLSLLIQYFNAAENILLKT